jgi:hypothetical protein
MEFAKVSLDNKVLNIESASQEWVDRHLADNSNAEYTYIAYTDENPAYIDGDLVDGYFYPPKPFDSWNRDGKGNWNPPVPMPEDGKIYTWNEEELKWEEVISD